MPDPTERPPLPDPDARAPALRLLVLGGGVFLGRHVVEAALQAGHAVTVLNRGRRRTDWPAAVEPLVGDRDGDLSALAGRHWDAVIDCSGYTPAQLQASTRALAGCGHYLFVSTISVYAGFPPHRPYDETAAVTTETTGYGGAKARAEEALAAGWPGDWACVRPGLIVGPHDPTGRFTHWPLRLAAGGEVLAPGRPGRPVQCIDVRDLAAWCLHLAGQRARGTFHAVGEPAPMAELLEACAAAAGQRPTLRWWPDDALRRAGATPWTGLPLWLPEDDPDHGGMLLADTARARAAGLRTRPWAETAADTLRWAQAEGWVLGRGAGLSAEDEAALSARLQALG